MNTYTKGHWVVEKELTTVDSQQVAAFSEDGNRIMQVVVRSFNPEQDAALIAAAPKLLDVLKRAVANNSIIEGSSWWSDVYSAIKEAEGHYSRREST